MTKILNLVLLFVLSMSAHASEEELWSINVYCYDQQPSPKKFLEINLNPEYSRAQLFYKSEEISTPVYIYIGSDQSLVSVNNQTNFIEIHATMRTKYQNLAFAEFSLMLGHSTQGKILVPKVLSYAQGSYEDPQNITRENIELAGLRCQTFGL